MLVKMEDPVAGEMYLPGATIKCPGPPAALAPYRPPVSTPTKCSPGSGATIVRPSRSCGRRKSSLDLRRLRGPGTIDGLQLIPLQFRCRFPCNSPAGSAAIPLPAQQGISVRISDKSITCDHRIGPERCRSRDCAEKFPLHQGSRKGACRPLTGRHKLPADCPAPPTSCIIPSCAEAATI